MADITLTSSSRNSLLSLTSTQELLGRTQNRLTSGLKVSSAIDNAVAFFTAKGIDDRSADFSDRKDQIDQGISSLKSAINGTTTSDSILKQLKGIVSSARTADSATRTSLTSQFGELISQLNSALTDSSYQGLNLVNGTTASLTVYFSQGTAAALTIQGQDLTASTVLSNGAAFQVSAGKTAALEKLISAAGISIGTGFSALEVSDGVSPAVVLDALSSYVDSATSKVRAAAAQLGSNVTFLNTRLDFTKNYINTLQEGSGKLTLADLNTEGANLLSLQTKQQIGTQSLSIANQQQQSILSLLR